MRHHWVHRRRQEGKCKQCGKVILRGTTLDRFSGQFFPIFDLFIFAVLLLYHLVHDVETMHGLC